MLKIFVSANWFLCALLSLGVLQVKTQCTISPSSTQSSALKNYVFPISSENITSILSGTFGELRKTHLHIGIDISTKGKTQVPVLAIANGYISRAAIYSTGYGLSVKIKHDDGYTSLYGHLYKFVGPYFDYIKMEQNRQRKSEISVDFMPHQFPIQKGDTIALSGNTGSSQAPHLHFEIHNDHNEAVNPIFYFSKIYDNAPPVPQKMAIKTMDIDARVNHLFGRKEFTLRYKNGIYTTIQPISISGPISIELCAIDRYPSNLSRLGVNYIDMYIDHNLVFTQCIEKVKLGHYYNIYPIQTFRSNCGKSSYYTKLYMTTSDPYPFSLTAMPNAGLLDLDSGSHLIDIRLKDVAGNESKVLFSLHSIPPKDTYFTSEKPTKNTLTENKRITWKILDNILIIKVKESTNKDTLEVKTRAGVTSVSPSYQRTNELTFLYDLRKSLPNSIHYANYSLPLPFRCTVPSNTAFHYYNNKFQITFSDNSLYDTLYLTTTILRDDKNISFEIGPDPSPLRNAIQVVYTLEQTPSNPKQWGVYTTNKKRPQYIGGTITYDQIFFSTTTLGQFKIMQDTTPPNMRTIQISPTRIRFRAYDNLSGIAKYVCTLDDTWIPLYYDAKSRWMYVYPYDIHSPLYGTLKITLTDYGDNSMTYQKILTP